MAKLALRSERLMRPDTVDSDLGRALQGPVIAVLNKASGSWTSRAPAEAAAILDAAGIAKAEIVCVSPRHLESALDRALVTASVLVVLGGDGTIRSAAAKCGGASALLVPLPGGTMNMLPKALYGARDWRTALIDTLANPAIRSVSGGRASGHPFYVAAIMGAPTLWAEVREALRGGKLGEAARRASTALRRGMSEPLDYRFGSERSGEAEAVAVMCPLVSKVMRGDESHFEAVAIDTRTAGELLRLGFNTLRDDWRADPSIRRAPVKSVIVTGARRIPVTLDGERVRLGRSVALDFLPLAFRALVPAPGNPT
jgi:diacylglycerol kinase family enzyme